MDPAKLHPLEAAALGLDEDEAPTRPDNGRVTSILPSLKDDRESGVVILKEAPWHRSLAYMLLNGMSQRECAKQFDKHPQYISQIRQQEWFKNICAQLAEIHFGGDLMGLLEGAAFDAVNTLQDLAVGAESESVRASSASTLLDKHLKYRKENKPQASDNPEQEIKRMDEEISRLEGEETNHKLI